ncbi:MAG: RHS repeat-associated core domain-containing protein, partial [Opitutaceae bacterium]
NNLTGYAQVVEERISSGGPTPMSASKVYTYGSGLISVARVVPNAATSVSYFVFDGGNTVRELADEAGAITDRYDYDAFGNLVFQSGSTTNAYRYCGEQFDADLGLYYLRARYLNPDSGRFWSMDSYEGSGSDPVSLHKYLYANADPVTYVDPTGNQTLLQVIVAQTLKVRMQLTMIVPAFAAGGAAIGRVWNQLGVAAQNAAQSVLMLFSKLNLTAQIPVANRVIDFALRVGNQVALLEAKYKIPLGVGDSMNRLVGQLNAGISSGQGQVVLWTFKEPTVAEVERLYAQMGAQAAQVQLIHGMEGLYKWVQFFFKIEGSG